MHLIIMYLLIVRIKIRATFTCLIYTCFLCLSVMYVVEFQKRGLPHVHMLIWLSKTAKQAFKSDVDKYISAEIPDEITDPYGFAAVTRHMIHGPCGPEFRNSPCMKAGKCGRSYPKK